jgi:hypothetical protein
MPFPKKGTPEYEAWILTSDYREHCKKATERLRARKNPIPKKGTDEYNEWILTPEYKEHCKKCINKNPIGKPQFLIKTPKKGTPEYEAWILTPGYRELCRKRSERMLGITGENHPAFGHKRPDVSERNKTIENRNKVSVSLSGENNPNFRKPRSKEAREKQSKKMMGDKNPNFRKSPSEATRALISIKNAGKKHPNLAEYNKSEEKRKSITGDKNPAWKNGVSFEPYCLKFNPRFKRNARTFQKYRCALCGHVWQPGEVALTVHHVHADKESCCNENSPRMFVCLCTRKGNNSKSCHHYTIGREEIFAGRFIRYLLKNFGGKSYFTKEEYAEYLSYHVQSG